MDVADDLAFHEEDNFLGDIGAMIGNAFKIFGHHD